MDHMISGYIRIYALLWLGSAVINIYALHIIFHTYDPIWENRQSTHSDTLVVNHN